MKELLKNKWAWAVLILVVINVATIGALWCTICGGGKNMECRRGEMNHPSHHGPGGDAYKHGEGGPRGGDYLSKELNLTEEQQASFEALRKEHFEKLKIKFDSLQVLKKSMVRSLGKKGTETTAIIQKIGSLEMTIQNETFNHFNKLYSICTDSQKVILIEKLENIMGHRGPGFAGKDSGDHHAIPGPHGIGQQPCCSAPPKRF